uniref:Ig-like domain-containing protein n=1 Tax=Oryzias sinensis TaxID=183150 RepID=A0A8C7UYD1_9TELE
MQFDSFLNISFFCFVFPVEHEISYFIGCFAEGSTEVLLEFDSEEVLYVDFEKEAVVFTGPSFFKANLSERIQGLTTYKNGKKNRIWCQLADQYFTAETEKRDPPGEVFLYTSAEVQPGVENTIICFVNGFYPPSIKVSWTKNGNPVSEGVSLSRYYPNKDQTFHQFFTLSFTPSWTDVYSCTVEHPALESPKTVLWEPEFHHQHPNLDVFLAASLGLGVLGFAVGTCLIIIALKRSECFGL